MRRELAEIYTLRVANFLRRIKPRILPESIPLEAECMVTDDPVPFDRRLDPGADYRPIGQGDGWGQAWQSAWFHLAGRVPETWAGRDVVLNLNLNGEACVFGEDGCPLYGLTNQSVFDTDSSKDIYRLFNPCRGGEGVDLWVEASASALFGVRREPDAERLAPTRHGQYRGEVVRLALAVFDAELWRLWLDLDVAFDLHQGLDPAEPRRARILQGLTRALDVFAEQPARAAEARAALKEILEVPPNPADLTVSAVGHAHIDTGWLWPVRESVRKCARTFASQVALLERYPTYVFGASQPQHYAFVKLHYPALYEKIRAFVKEGRWECQGGMWVEADCNVPSGESLVRQFVHGKNFFRDEFGADVKNLWIPDVFGYSASLPQIMKQAGCDVFLTQKLSWSKHNRFPHSTFRWRGIDGTEVLTHFPPEDTYNSRMRPGSMRKAQQQFNENGYIPEFISLFGIGNGGGGPTEEHVERGLRMHALNGCPAVRFAPAQAFFERLQAYADQLETWSGELYLEVHRGTLTTQAATKRANRKLELRLRETEFLCACLPPDRYPADKLDRVWKALLLNQFHDILPGSSIAMVYETTSRELAEGLVACDGLIARAAGEVLTPEADALTLFNTLSCLYTAPIQLPASWAGHEVLDEAGAPLPVLQDEPGPMLQRPVSPQSFAVVHKGPPLPDDPTDGGPSALVLENDLIRYTFGEDAVLMGAFDKEAGEEILPEGETGNVLSLYIDRPHAWDAWDIDLWYEHQLLEQARPVRSRVLGGPATRTRLRFELAIGDSTITQSVALSPHSKRLDFETEVDWKEIHKMLRVAFPTRIHADEATFDIQYGYLRRPTHRNTGWDMARFEVTGHRYVDLSDEDCGVALLNDCKYGHKVHGHVLDLNLLRSPTDPDPDADYGRHAFTYSLLPHRGGLLEADVMEEAAMLNQPPLLLEGYRPGEAALPCTLESEGISLEVVKRAEKEACHVIRLVETRGRRSAGRLHLDRAGARLVETDLLEWSDGPALDGPAVELILQPFEIRTYKILS